MGGAGEVQQEEDDEDEEGSGTLVYKFALIQSSNRSSSSLQCGGGLQQRQDLPQQQEGTSIDWSSLPDGGCRVTYRSFVRSFIRSLFISTAGAGAVVLCWCEFCSY